MEQPEDIDILALSLSTLFCAYGKEDQMNRLEIYYKALFELDPILINYACKKCVYNSTFLPSIAEIIEVAKNIEFELHPENKLKPWDEALIEITEAVRKASPTKAIKWSTPEIAQAIQMYGFANLCFSTNSSYSYGIETIRKYYIAICQRIQNSTQNKGLLGIRGGNILGIPDRGISKTDYNSSNPTLISDIVNETFNKKKEGDQ